MKKILFLLAHLFLASASDDFKAQHEMDQLYEKYREDIAAQNMQKAEEFLDKVLEFGKKGVDLRNLNQVLAANSGLRKPYMAFNLEGDWECAGCHGVRFNTFYKPVRVYGAARAIELEKYAFAKDFYSKRLWTEWGEIFLGSDDSADWDWACPDDVDILMGIFDAAG